MGTSSKAQVVLGVVEVSVFAHLSPSLRPAENPHTFLHWVFLLGGKTIKWGVKWTVFIVDLVSATLRHSPFSPYPT